MAVTERKRQVRLSKALVARFAVAVLLICGFGSSVAAQTMVVRASGPSASSYPVGRKLETGARITLGQADRVTVLDQAGTTVLQGPGTFTIGARAGNAAAGSNLNERLAGFVNRKGSIRGRLGVVRGAGDDPTLSSPIPSLWFLDVTRSGTFCLSGEAGLMTWRPDMNEQTRLAIIKQPGTPPATLDFSAGSRIRVWPVEAAPLGDGLTYRLALPGKAEAEAATIRFAVLNEPPTDVPALAALLAEKGCSVQLDRLIDAAGAN